MKQLLTLLLLALSVQLFAQSYPISSITISLPANPDANTANWGSSTPQFMISATAKAVNGRVDIAVESSKILVTIKKGSSKICGAYSSGSAPSANFNSQTKVWSGSAALSLLGQDCTLPPGDYELSVQFFGNGTGGSMAQSEERTKGFTIRGTDQQTFQAPQALMPANGSVFKEVDLQKPIIFRWTAVVPKPQDPTTYRIKVWQLMQGQNSTLAIKANQPIYTKDIDNLTQATVNNIITGPCKPPYLCEFVWNVQALNRDGKPIGGNNGTSESLEFGVNNNTLRKNTISDTTAYNNSTPKTPIDTGKASIGDTIRAGFNGEFKIAVKSISVENDGSLTGKGVVTVNWLSTNIAVEFSKIRIDTTKRLTAGGIVTEKSAGANYIQAWLTSNLTAVAATIPLDKPTTWTNNTVDNLIDWANNHNFGLPPVNYQANLAAPPIPANSLKMPFGVKFSNPDDALLITEIVFKPNVSKINFLVQKKFSKGVTDYKLGFAGKYFVIHPNNIDFSNGRVELVEDINVPNLTANPKMTFTFKKGEPQKGCYIEWDSTGIKDIRLGLDIKFSRDWLLPVPKATDSVKATIAGNGTSLKDIILTGSLNNCEIVGTKGVKLQVDSIAMDLSDTRNAPSMYFPANYIDDTTAANKVLWQGFYMKKFKLTLPDTWKTGANPTEILAKNCIIDDQGVTLKILATNIISFPIGRVSDMSASLDTLDLSILKGSLTNGNAKGKLVLPISKDTISNTLKYTATFAQAAASNSLQIVIVPTGPIDADVFKGKMTLLTTSNISANLTDTLKSMSINLNGKFDWGDKDFSVSDTTTNTGGASVRKKGIKGIKMEMDFQNVSLAYSRNATTDASDLNFNPGTWSFASPQKRLANFPVTIKKVYYKSLTKVAPTNTNFKELVRGALMIDIIANLTDDIGGKTTVGAAFAIEQDKGNFLKFVPKFKGVFIEDIEVHADMPAVKIDGKLKMYDNDPTYGDGFSASLGVKFTAVSVEANALVQFGNTTYNNNNQYYRYWRAEADVKFEPGIPFLPGIGFYGFGGGAFFNMEAIRQQRAAPGVGYKYIFKPKKSSLGFQVEATIATIPKFETFNADVSLLAQFTNSGGLTKIGFLGDFWLAAKLSEREPNPKIKGGVVVEYNFTQKIFYMGANLAINVPNVIKTTSPFGFVMNIDGGTNKWYFKAGTPNATNDINVFGLNLYSYLMFGNDIPAPTGFTQKFANNYHNATGDWPNNGNVAATNGVGPNSATGKGIAAGVGIQFSRDVTRNIYDGVCRTWSIDGYVRAGAEINLALMQQNGCIGINGYRASGSIGLYGSVAAIIRGASFRDACDSKQYDLFVIKTGAWLTGKFPNPEYVAGTLTARVNLFDGLIDIPYSQSFQLGTDCVGTEVVTSDAPEEDAAAELYNQLILSVTPTTKYEFPITSPINVKYALVPDKVFDVAENQGNGNITNRTFKLVVTRKLEMKNASGSWDDMATIVRANNMGEYQYIKKSTSLNSSGNLSKKAGAGLNANSGNLLITSNSQQFNSNTIPSSIPPPPPINYPNPTPDLKNTLELNKDYRFTIEATLMEYGPKEVANTGVSAGRGTGFHTVISWAPAKTKTAQVITQKKVINFSTGPMQAVNANNLNKGAIKK